MHQQDTARMTDDDTSDGGEVNSTAATREPKEGYNSEDCPVDDDDAAKHIFMENVVNYTTLSFLNPVALMLQLRPIAKMMMRMELKTNNPSLPSFFLCIPSPDFSSGANPLTTSNRSADLAIYVHDVPLGTCLFGG